MESVDKLREWSKRYDNNWIDPKTGEMTVVYGTNGDCRPSGEYERFSVNEGEMMCELLDEVEREHEMALSLTDMAEGGWVRGPLDADGKMWHSGDMSDSNWGVIEGIAYEDGQWLVRGHDISAPWMPADSIRHYHAPTVEDVLREFAEKITDSQIPGVHPTYEESIAEYAAKLRLANDEKEQQ